MKYNGYDLMAAGFRPRPEFKDMISAANEAARNGISSDDVFAELHRLFPPAPPKLQIREAPADCFIACDAATPDEMANRSAAIDAITDLLKIPIVNRGALMPDTCVAGSAPCTIPVGGVIEAHEAIIPGAHSADICCSMYATFYRCDAIPDMSVHLDACQSVTRFGVGGRRDEDVVYHAVQDEPVWGNSFLRGFENLARIHMADQGDGNHFAYIGTCVVSVEMIRAIGFRAWGLEAGQTYSVLVTHHGSRAFGAKVYKRGLAAAVKHTAQIADNIPPAAAWLDAQSDLGKEYWDALQYIERWTIANHESIHARFLCKLGAVAYASLYNAHNFVWRDGPNYYHGKGATPAGEGIIGLIPLNMTEPILIVRGRGNSDACNFAPHGAGRNLSRTALAKKLDGDDGAYARGTVGVDARWYSGIPDISETSLAYKNADAVRAQIIKYKLADEIGTILPYGCIMAGHIPKPWLKK